MRIGEFCRNLGIGGIEAMVCGLSNALSTENDVVVCTLVPPAEDDLFYRELRSSIRRTSIGHKPGDNPFKILIQTARFIRREAFDIVHIHGFFYFYSLAVLLYHHKYCFCYTVHSTALKENNPWDLRLLPFKRFCFKRGWVHPITISSSSKQSFAELYRCDSKLITNGVAMPVFHWNPEIVNSRITPRTKVFIHASRIAPEKKQVMLCKVFQRLVDDGQDVMLLIAGPVHYGYVFDAIRPYFSERIRYIGCRTDIPSVLYSADAMCLSSSYEGMPVILLESLMAGCIPVCAAVGGIADVVKDGYNGFLAAEASESALYEAIKRFLSLSEIETNRMRQACKESGKQYEISKVAKDYQFYFNALKG